MMVRRKSIKETKEPVDILWLELSELFFNRSFPESQIIPQVQIFLVREYPELCNYAIQFYEKLDGEEYLEVKDEASRE